MLDPEIKLSVRKLFVKFLVFQGVIFAAAVVLSIAVTAYYKQRLGTQLGAASRDSLVSGDARQVIVTIPSSMAKDFSGMTWRPAGGEDGFSVPPGAEAYGALVYSRAVVPVYFDDADRFPAGAMSFYYPRWTPVIWAFFAWLAIALLSLPVALYERRRLIQDYNLLLELKIKESYSALAAQVAHDIRSPLAALGAAAKGLGASPEQRDLVNGAVERMQSIANDLLARYRAPGAEPAPASRAAAPAPCDLAPLLSRVVAEKRLQYGERQGVAIVYAGPASGVAGEAEPTGLQRIISNLVNNSVESFASGGEVFVSLSAVGGKAIIEVRDNGAGIPAELLDRLGQKGETHGKRGGTGLGLYHARTAVEAWGGSFLIASEPGKGTSVKLNLPLKTGPAAVRRAVLLDDDKLVHMNWRLAAKAAGVELSAFKTPAELAAAVAGLPKDIPLYIDSDLGDGVRGEEIAAGLRTQGFSDITMATGHAPENFSTLPWLKVTGKEPPF